MSRAIRVRSKCLNDEHQGRFLISSPLRKDVPELFCSALHVGEGVTHHGDEQVQQQNRDQHDIEDQQGNRSDGKWSIDVVIQVEISQHSQETMFHTGQIAEKA